MTDRPTSSARALRESRASARRAGPPALRRDEVARYLHAAIEHVDGMSDFLTVTLRRKGLGPPRPAAPRMDYGDDVAEVVDALEKADAFAASCASGLSRFLAWRDVTPEIWEACWRGAARGWSSLVRIACLRCAAASGIDLDVPAPPAR
jgi:hypothetical protein